MGCSFLEIMNEHKNIDLVLLDIKMPGINGFNAIKVVRQQNITVPVIAQTAFNQPEDKQRCLDSGCNDYLAKPIDKDLLLNKIARFLSN
jgi:CheY-like chemotaxis protein